jgi:hypothetical protein
MDISICGSHDTFNVVDLYQPLAMTYQRMEFTNNSEAIGFLQCLYLLKRELKRYKNFNLHILNHDLIRENVWLKKNNENQKKEIKQLIEEIKQLRTQIKTGTF